jgi:hypothetical protein
MPYKGHIFKKIDPGGPAPGFYYNNGKGEERI